jgi:hypothetical protein
MNFKRGVDGRPAWREDECHDDARRTFEMTAPLPHQNGALPELPMLLGWDETDAPPEKADTTIPQGVPCTRLANLIRAPKEEKHCSSFV